jgi:hypothetical protein
MERAKNTDSALESARMLQTFNAELTGKGISLNLFDLNMESEVQALSTALTGSPAITTAEHKTMARRLCQIAMTPAAGGQQ